MYDKMFNDEVELILDQYVNNINNKFEHGIVRKYRFYAEKINTIISILPQIDECKIELNEIALSVICNSFSKFFFPELTHVGIEEYDRYYYKFYTNIQAIVETYGLISIVDIGSGVCELGLYLLENSFVDKYYAIDFNQYITYANKKYFSNDRLIICNENVFLTDLTIDSPDAFFIFGFARLYNTDTITNFIINILNQYQLSIIIIYDYVQLLNALKNRLETFNIICVFESEFLIVYKTYSDEIII